MENPKGCKTGKCGMPRRILPSALPVDKNYFESTPKQKELAQLMANNTLLFRDLDDARSRLQKAEHRLDKIESRMFAYLIISVISAVICLGIIIFTPA
jgi:hypothetical protein